MSYPNYRHDLWKAYFPSRRDVQAALERFERQEPLDADLWRALLWHNTSIPTAEIYPEVGTKRLYLGTTIGDPERVNYLRVSRLCEPLGPWVRAVGGIVAMREALGLLADDRERQNGWNALCGATNGGDAPNCPELSTARQVLRQLRDVAEQKALVMVDGGAARPEPIPAVLRPDVERELTGIGQFFGKEGEI